MDCTHTVPSHMYKGDETNIIGEDVDII